jgi:hypothetical protein
MLGALLKTAFLPYLLLTNTSYLLPLPPPPPLSLYSLSSLSLELNLEAVVPLDNHLRGRMSIHCQELWADKFYQTSLVRLLLLLDETSADV